MNSAALHVTHTPARGTRRGTVVAVHGMMESGPTLQAAANAWAAGGWEVLAPDLRGHGRSPRWDPADQLHLGDRLTEDLVAVLDALDEGARAGTAGNGRAPELSGPRARADRSCCSGTPPAAA